MDPPSPPELPPFEPPRPRLRALELRERDAVLRFGLALLAGDLRAAPVRLAPVEDFARVVLDLLAALLLRAAVVPDFARDEVLRVELELRAPVLREAPPELAELLVPSSLHLPDITRWAASATASAIKDPSLVALDIMLLAAWLAVSAASRPASRIARRAFGLALIAAAAAASPAASISLLIAALASLSTVVSLLFEEDPDELLRVDLAIALSPSVAGKTLQARNGSRMSREAWLCRYVKGHRRGSQRCPSTWSAAEGVAVRQQLEPTNTPLRPLC